MEEQLIGRHNERGTDEQEEEVFEHRKTILRLICKPSPHITCGVPIRIYAIKPSRSGRCICIGCKAFA